MDTYYRSTVIGQGLDSLLFIRIAFWGTSPANVLVAAIITQWIFNTAYEALATPLTYAVVNHIKQQEGVDVYDDAISLNPLSVAD